MAIVFCDNCGVSLLEENAKFCRACGKSTPPLSEASTKRFEQQPIFQTPTSQFGPTPTTPAYMGPFEYPSAAQTLDLQRKRKRNVILIVSMLAFLIFALGGLLIFLNLQDEPSAGVIVDAPSIGKTVPPTIPVAPSPPPLPPPPPGIDTPTKIDSLIYPGSQTTMTVTKEGGNKVLQLHSDDPASKVVKWYLSKLRTTKNV
ncbi:MAG: zinc ribbon domain-containing protein, partial [Acidobacteriota bacterium]